MCVHDGEFYTGMTETTNGGWKTMKFLMHDRPTDVEKFGLICCWIWNILNVEVVSCVFRSFFFGWRMPLLNFIFETRNFCCGMSLLLFYFGPRTRLFIFCFKNNKILSRVFDGKYDAIYKKPVVLNFFFI